MVTTEVRFYDHNANATITLLFPDGIPDRKGAAIEGVVSRVVREVEDE